MTGAAGLIGGELAARLTANGHRVTALVHRNREIRANDGSLVAVADGLAGDVSRERFGWDEGAHARVAAAHDLVIHCAASVRFDLSDEEYAAVNVAGTRHAIDLARAGGAGLLHVSTAYVCGLLDGRALEDEVPAGTLHANGYERSKAAGERAVRQSGLDWVIARPSVVVGDSRTGAIRSFDAIYGAFRLIAEGRVRRLPATPNASLDLVPIDHVAAGLAHLAAHMERAAGTTVHLTADLAMPLPGFVDAIGRWPAFATPELVPASEFDEAELPAAERRMWRRVAGVYATYFQRNPRFVTAQLAALGGPACAPTDAAFLHRLMGWAVEAGFLPGEDAQRTSG